MAMPVRWLSIILSVGILATFIGSFVLVLVVEFTSQNLPDHSHLADFKAPVSTRVFDRDGALVAEFADERREFVPIDRIPDRVIHAFLAAEDKNFFEHRGVDPWSIGRALLVDATKVGRDSRPMGASTITQQVVKNLLLSNELSVVRKIREAVLAVEIERSLSKERILELYLNQIFLGDRAFGVAAAASVYFGKSLDDLTIAEAALLGGLPKAPTSYSPARFPAAALARRNWVIGQMLNAGWIDEHDAAAAREEPLRLRDLSRTDDTGAGWYVDELRRRLVQRYGEETVYRRGIDVVAPFDRTLQAVAYKALRDGLAAYDERHGWRGPVRRLAIGDWAAVDHVDDVAGLGRWRMAVVTELRDEAAVVRVKGGSVASLPLEGLRWARTAREDGGIGPGIRSCRDVLHLGDVIVVEPVSATGDGRSIVRLRQIPAVQGGLVAMVPAAGEVVAMVGGFADGGGGFNRATQALRQPGSAFKPFVYLAGFENGATPSTIVLDAPFEYEQAPGSIWRPSNYEHDFLGPATIRTAIEKSRNVMTVRLAHGLGMDKVGDMAVRFGVVDSLPDHLSYALGAAETTVMRLTTAYAMLANGGRKIEPGFQVAVDCAGHFPVPRRCFEAGDAPPIVDPRIAYQMVHVLEGVVRRGTAAGVLAGAPYSIAGKTGTTNDSRDAWFVGFSPRLAIGVYVGFDTPKGLGHGETGARVAAPIFKEVMDAAEAAQPAGDFVRPAGVSMVRVDRRTGLPTASQGRDSLDEAFLDENLPGTAPDLSSGGGPSGAEAPDDVDRSDVEVAGPSQGEVQPRQLVENPDMTEPVSSDMDPVVPNAEPPVPIQPPVQVSTGAREVPLRRRSAH